MEILRKIDNEIEFYTVELTGQSGMSQSGLAILAGVTRQSLINLEETLVNRSPSETLKPFVGEALTLVISDPTIDGRAVGNLKIYKASYCANVWMGKNTTTRNELTRDLRSEVTVMKWFSSVIVYYLSVLVSLTP